MGLFSTTPTKKLEPAPAPILDDASRTATCADLLAVSRIARGLAQKIAAAGVDNVHAVAARKRVDDVAVRFLAPFVGGGRSHRKDEVVRLPRELADTLSRGFNPPFCEVISDAQAEKLGHDAVALAHVEPVWVRWNVSITTPTLALPDGTSIPIAAHHAGNVDAIHPALAAMFEKRRAPWKKPGAFMTRDDGVEVEIFTRLRADEVAALKANAAAPEPPQAIDVDDATVAADLIAVLRKHGLIGGASS